VFKCFNLRLLIQADHHMLNVAHQKILIFSTQTLSSREGTNFLGHTLSAVHGSSQASCSKVVPDPCAAPCQNSNSETDVFNAEKKMWPCAKSLMSDSSVVKKLAHTPGLSTRQRTHRNFLKM
jgi:hypothetical protein